jgi:hypothetical protein
MRRRGWSSCGSSRKPEAVDIDSSSPHIAKWLFALPAFLAGEAAEELRSYIQYEFGSPNIILIRCQDFPAALSACLNFADSIPSLPRAIEACIAASACCSYSRFNSLLSSAITILGVVTSEAPRKLGKVTGRPAACSQSREPCDASQPLATRMITSL